MSCERCQDENEELHLELKTTKVELAAMREDHARLTKLLDEAVAFETARQPSPILKVMLGRDKRYHFALNELRAVVVELIFKPPDRSKTDNGLEARLRVAIAAADEALK